MKKILAILMAMMMIMTECVCVFAEECNLDEQVIVESAAETATVTAEDPEILEESETVTEPAEEETAAIVTDEAVVLTDNVEEKTAGGSDCGSIDEPINSEPVQEVIPETVAQPETEVAETENAEIVSAPVEVANEDTDSDTEEQIPAEVTVAEEEKVAAEVTAIEETAIEPVAEVENVQSENATETATPEITETVNEGAKTDEEPAEEEKIIGMAVILEETPLYTSPEGEEIKDVILLEGELCVVYEYDDLWSYIGYYENKGYVETRLLVPYVREEKKEEVPAEMTAEIAETETIVTTDEENGVSEVIDTIEETVVDETINNETVENGIEDNNEIIIEEEIVTDAAEAETVTEITNAELGANDPEALETGDNKEEPQTVGNENTSEVILPTVDNDSTEVLIVEESVDGTGFAIETEVGAETADVIIEETTEAEPSEVVNEDAVNQEITAEEIHTEEIKGQTIRKTKLYNADGEVQLTVAAGTEFVIIEIGENQTKVRYEDYVGIINNEDIALLTEQPSEKLRSISITSNIEHLDTVCEGTLVELSVELTGFDGLEYNVQWQVTPDGGLTAYDIAGAQSMTYRYYITKENFSYGYRVIIDVAE